MLSSHQPSQGSSPESPGSGAENEMNGVINTVSNTSSADSNVNATVSRDATTPTDAAIDAETSDEQVIDVNRTHDTNTNASDRDDIAYSTLIAAEEGKENREFEERIEWAEDKLRDPEEGEVIVDAAHSDADLKMMESLYVKYTEGRSVHKKLS